MVKKIIRHPSYNIDAMWDNNVALLQLDETIVMNDVIRPICLPNTAKQQRLVRLSVGTFSFYSKFSCSIDLSIISDLPNYKRKSK